MSIQKQYYRSFNRTLSRCPILCLLRASSIVCPQISIFTRHFVYRLFFAVYDTHPNLWFYHLIFLVVVSQQRVFCSATTMRMIDWAYYTTRPFHRSGPYSSIDRSRSRIISYVFLSRVINIYITYALISGQFIVSINASRNKQTNQWTTCLALGRFGSISCIR